jgi:hypothetical protein
VWLVNCLNTFLIIPSLGLKEISYFWVGAPGRHLNLAFTEAKFWITISDVISRFTGRRFSLSCFNAR